MSLMKSFNFKFLKENIKKSKGGIILSLIIVPLILSIYMVVTGMNADTVEIISDESFGNMSLVFMYIIPFVYSVMLFGFVFKKPSTDFMNSMPINRKTMFITNTVGGIILITIMHLLAALLTLLWSLIYTNLVVFPMDIIETMLMSWCSYVFIFTVANLAMSISGTVMTQLLVTILILFLVPVCSVALKGMKSVKRYDNSYVSRYEDSGITYSSYDLSIADGYQVTHYNLSDKLNTYTMPFNYISNGGYHFSSKVMIKMIILSAVYCFIGLQLYKRRKMEDTEESFGNTKFHIFIKALTLLPVFLLLNIADFSDDITPFVVMVIFCAIYYFIFDLIIKKKVNFKTTVVSFFFTVFVLQALCGTTRFLIREKPVDIDYEDIKAISVGKSSEIGGFTDYFYSSTDDDNIVFDGDYYVNDAELLDLILEGKAEMEDDDRTYYNGYKQIYFNVKLKSGKTYNTRISVPQKTYNKIVRYVQDDEDYMKHMRNKVLASTGIYKYDDQILDSKFEKALDKEIKNNIENYTSTNDYSSDYFTVRRIAYQNHDLIYYNVPIDLTDKTLEIVANSSNEATMKNIRGYEYGLSATVYKNSDEDYYVGSVNDADELLEFIEENIDEEFNPNKKYYIINGSLSARDGYKSFIFFTNNVDEVYKLTNNPGNQYLYD